ncbi:hypothetical protein SOVF_012090 [Spinacia oleracea]|nr:hypothetical protein SOVF_012090 [Spinacia oleracea]
MDSIWPRRKQGSGPVLNLVVSAANIVERSTARSSTTILIIVDAGDLAVRWPANNEKGKRRALKEGHEGESQRWGKREQRRRFTSSQQLRRFTGC